MVFLSCCAFINRATGGLFTRASLLRFSQFSCFAHLLLRVPPTLPIRIEPFPIRIGSNSPLTEHLTHSHLTAVTRAGDVFCFRDHICYGSRICCSVKNVDLSTKMELSRDESERQLQIGVCAIVCRQCFPQCGVCYRKRSFFHSGRFSSPLLPSGDKRRVVKKRQQQQQQEQHCHRGTAPDFEDAQ